MKKTTKTSLIIESLGQRLKAGEWPPGAALPTVATLSKEFDVSPGTVALALKSLEHQGRLRVIPRVGVLATGGGDLIELESDESPALGLYGAYSMNTSEGYMGRLTQGILDTAHAAGSVVQVLPRLSEGTLTASYCRSRGIKGLIVLGGAYTNHLALLREEGFPVITANQPIGLTPLNFYSYDFNLAIREFVEQSVHLGHRRIGVISHESSTQGLIESLKPGFFQQMLDFGLVYNFNDYWHNLGSPQQATFKGKAEAALADLFSLPEPPTMLLCRTCSVEHVQQWLSDQQIKIPEQISLVGLGYEEDETLSSGFILRHRELGAQLVSSLYEIIRNPFHSVQKHLPFLYCDRGSTAAPPSQPNTRFNLSPRVLQS